MAVTDVADPFDMSLAAISKHLMILTRAGLISQEKRGRVKWCRLEPDALKSASVWMQGFGQFEPVNLDAFEAFLEQELNQDAEYPFFWSKIFRGVWGAAPPHLNGQLAPQALNRIARRRSRALRRPRARLWPALSGRW